MITAIVLYDLPTSIGLEEMPRAFQQDRAGFSQSQRLRPQAVHLPQGRRRRRGRLYVGNQQDAEAFYTGPWREGIRARYGNDPKIQYFENRGADRQGVGQGRRDLVTISAGADISAVMRPGVLHHRTGHAAPDFTQASTSAPASFCVPGAGSRPKPGASGPADQRVLADVVDQVFQLSPPLRAGSLIRAQIPGDHLAFPGHFARRQDAIPDGPAPGPDTKFEALLRGGIVSLVQTNRHFAGRRGADDRVEAVLMRIPT